MLTDVTVIEQARRAAGISQQQMARWSGTQQSSVSEYESRKKSPTLEVVERLLEAADAELAVKPVIDFDERQDSEGGTFLVPDRLWSVPMPDCFSKIQVAGIMFGSPRTRVWDLSVEAERIDYYEWAIVGLSSDLMLDSIDGILLMQVWERLNIPDVVQAAWQPVIDAATVSQDRSPRDPAGFSAWITKQVGVEWRPIRKRKPRPQKPIPPRDPNSTYNVWRRLSSSSD
ncbi:MULTISPECIES: helix-turn-helix domain-containing protein [unclassified Aeromicrobium]|uniref:helix-turn-helix domain-containing protein n=1 Tax=unclassified Aeromicrobium TaxID=2633570 RepID=UPI00396B3D7B